MSDREKETLANKFEEKIELENGKIKNLIEEYKDRRGLVLIEVPIKVFFIEQFY